MLQLAYTNTNLFYLLIQMRKPQRFGSTTGCLKTFPPNANHLKERTCKNLWKQAKRVFMRLPEAIKDITQYSNTFKRTDQIYVENADPRNDPDICYKSKAYKTKGWCRVVTTVNTAKTWGICSSSCRYFVSLVFARLTYYILKHQLLLHL